MNNINEKPKTFRAIVASTKIKELRNLYFNNAFVFICRNLIQSKVFENGLCMREGATKDCLKNLKRPFKRGFNFQCVATKEATKINFEVAWADSEE